MGRTKDLLLDRENAEKEAFLELYDSHDCHNDPDDGCQICARYYELFGEPPYIENDENN